MADEPQPPSFPNYPPAQPAPAGIPFVDARFHKPLYKMMKALMTKGKHPTKMKIRTSRRGKKPKFY